MITKGTKVIGSVAYGTKVIQAVYRGLKLVWQSVRSCFGSGAWINEKPWSNDEGWKNE